MPNKINFLLCVKCLVLSHAEFKQKPQDEIPAEKDCPPAIRRSVFFAFNGMETNQANKTSPKPRLRSLRH